MRRISGVLLTGALLLVFAGYPAASDARVNVDIGVNIALPPLAFPAPPEVVVIPGTYVYFVPGIEADVFFYHGYWYRPYRDYWFRARAYNGPWVGMVSSRVPRVLVSLPPDFRHVPPGYRHVPYGELRGHWRAWERDRYWDRHEERERGRGREHYREERREHREERER